MNKKLLIVGVLCAVVLISGCAKTQQASNNKDDNKQQGNTVTTEGYIKNIQDNLATFEKKEREIIGMGNSLISYWQNDEIKRIDTSNSGVMGKVARHYYYQGDKLVLLEQISEVYDEPNGKVVDTQNIKYYFTDEKLVKETKNDVQVEIAYVEVFQKSLLWDSAQLLKAAKEDPALIPMIEPEPLDN